jgi:alanyl-tRNA synthetase
LANWALREVLGDGVQQKGSLVDPEKLRFDFSHGKALSDEELARVEELVNQEIGKKLTVYAQEAPQEQALKISGLRAVFGEKYPPMVRVVSVGAPVDELLADPTNAKWRQFSVEFCGGTHLANSRHAQHFAIMAEESVSKGIRRLLGITGREAGEAIEHAHRIDTLIHKARQASDGDLQPLIALLNQSIPTLPLRSKRRAQAAVAELQTRQRAFEKATKAKGNTGAGDVMATAAQLFNQATPLGAGKLVVGEIPGASDDQLRSAMDSIKKKSASVAVLLGASDGEKVTFIAAVSDDLIAGGLKAGDWVRETAKIAGGGGGGRPQMAQAGGKDPSKLNEALDKARAFASATVK